MSDRLVGKVVGGYEVKSLIGQGGMASVYLARQRSMNRHVALKILPRQFLQDDTYLQRFEQEVNIVSKLEHRNIVPVYDYGEYEEQPYIAMRYMPGGSVDERIKEGALDIDTVLSIVTQIAPALDYAYSKNVLHRDLKPSNILLDDDGGAFLTDFGIARILGEKGIGITTQGVVGTPSYMSPEQAQGFPLSSRSDVYSVGIMLFEMLTGRRPFENDTPYGIAVMQVTAEPPKPSTVNSNISPAVEHVILKALRKKPEDRYEKVTDLANALKEAIENPENTRETERIVLQQKQPAPVAEAGRQSPDGSSSINVPVAASVPDAYRQPISNSNELIRPVSSPTGSRVNRPVRRRSLLFNILIGGTVGCALLAMIIFVGALAIGALGNTNITPSPSDSNEIGATVEVTENPVLTLPPLNPTEQAAATRLSEQNADADATFTVVAQETANTPPLNENGTADVTEDSVSGFNRFSDAEGFIVFFDARGENNTFEIINMNLETGEEIQLTEDASDNSYPVASPDGRWIVFQSNRDEDEDFEIFMMDRRGGNIQQLTFNDRWDRLPAWSPDGQWIVYSSDTRGDQTFDIFMIRPDGTDEQLVFSNGQRNSHVRWFGDTLIFTSGADPQDNSTWEIVRLDMSDPENPVHLTDNEWRDASPSFSPDGEEILYVTNTGEGSDIAVMDISGNNREIVYEGEGNEWSANYSPDGRYIVFTSTIDQEDQVYLMTADGEEIQQLTTDGGSYASWIPAIPN